MDYGTLHIYSEFGESYMIIYLCTNSYGTNYEQLWIYSHTSSSLFLSKEKIEVKSCYPRRRIETAV